MEEHNNIAMYIMSVFPTLGTKTPKYIQSTVYAEKNMTRNVYYECFGACKVPEP